MFFFRNGKQHPHKLSPIEPTSAAVSLLCNVMKLASLLLNFHILLGSLLPHADYTELSKLSDLYEHYQLHQRQSNGQLGLADFLALHYTNQAHQQSEDDVQLPFQHHHSYTAIVFFFLPDINFQFTPLLMRASMGFRWLSFFFPSYLSSIFQPPKQVDVLIAWVAPTRHPRKRMSCGEYQ